MKTAGHSKRRSNSRTKISTTISPGTSAYLQSLIREGRASNLAEAIDLLVTQLREIEARERLERETTAYYDSLTDEEVEEERAWGEFVTQQFADPKRWE
jgi:hypothetical protein